MHVPSLTFLLALCAPQDPLPEVPVAPPAWTVKGDADALGSAARVDVISADKFYMFSVGAFGRVSWPFGAVSDQDAVIVGNVVVIPDHLRYSDLFEVGWGVALEASFNLFTPRRGGGGGREEAMGYGGLQAGVYVSLQRDSYEGDRISEGPVFIDPDSLGLTCGFIGLKVITDMGGGGYGAGHIGIGVARFDAVDARVSLTGGGDDSQEMLDASQEFAFESRYRFSARLGPLSLTGGVGIRIMGSPDEGSSPLGDLLDTHTFWTFDADFGLELGF